MTSATCRLCLKERPLQESHLLAAGFYKIIRDNSPSDEHPVWVSSDGVALSTSRQTTAPMLCGECEQRFNKKGEDWVLKNCCRGAGQFPLQKLAHEEFGLVGTWETLESTGYSPGSASVIAQEQLVYFGASVFWRAAARSWNTPLGKQSQLEFGPCQEKFRKFLLGEQPLPKGFVLIVTLNIDLNNNVPFELPQALRKCDTYRQYQFRIPGICFLGLLGAKIAPELRTISTFPAGYLHATSGSEWSETMREVITNSKLKGKLNAAVGGTLT